MVVTSAVNESELESDEEDDLLFLKVHIQELEVLALIDAGAQVNCISKSLVKKLGYKMKERTEEIDTCGGKAKVLGIIDELIITINGINVPVKRVRVMDIANHDLILGISWLRKMKNTQDLKTNRFTINFNGIETQLQLKSKKEFLTEDEENQIFFEEEVHSEENADEGEHHKAVFTSTRVEKSCEEISSDLTSEQAKLVQELLEEKKDVFAQELNQVGRTNVLEHTIDTEKARPRRSRIYRLPRAHDDIHSRRNR